MRTNLDSTQLIQRPVWQNPRVHLLDDIWLLTIVAILVATGVPWFASGFEPDFGMASWGLLALGGIYIAFSLMASPTPSRGRWRAHGLTLLDSIGVILIGFIWQHVGALQNPLFLAVFALPVIGAIFLSRWHPYFIAALSVVVVARRVHEPGAGIALVRERPDRQRGLADRTVRAPSGRRAAALLLGFLCADQLPDRAAGGVHHRAFRLRGGRRIPRHDFRAPERAQRHGAQPRRSAARNCG